MNVTFYDLTIDSVHYVYLTKLGPQLKCVLKKQTKPDSYNLI